MGVRCMAQWLRRKLRRVQTPGNKGKVGSFNVFVEKVGRPMLSLWRVHFEVGGEDSAADVGHLAHLHRDEAAERDLDDDLVVVNVPRRVDAPHLRPQRR